ncbi:hypothetical protein [Christensenella minuta]|uniref:hypothetical protein n=1 Tax=Christensenella minuta TaxID=626937 RepID=UPI0012E6F5D5|nr:hypothetical protein [Christensenella minuta]
MLKQLSWDGLTPAVLNGAEAVYVHAPYKPNGHKERQIDICCDLVGILPASLLYGLQT